MVASVAALTLCFLLLITFEMALKALLSDLEGDFACLVMAGVVVAVTTFAAGTLTPLAPPIVLVVFFCYYGPLKHATQHSHKSIK